MQKPKANPPVSQLRLVRDGALVATAVRLADRPWLRFRGLLGRTEFAHGEALVITRCNCVHMFFMKFAIDVVFCNSAGDVLRLCQNLRPWQMSPYVLGATMAIELPTGTIAEHGIRVGDRLQLQ